MRTEAPRQSLQFLCSLFGKTRQAYYEALAFSEQKYIHEMIVLTIVKEIRTELPLLGTRKLLFLAGQQIQEHKIKMGRDQLFSLLRFHGLLIRRRQRIAKTTDSHHWLKKYKNLIKELIINGPEQLWVSDITYIKTREGFSYLSLITDAYSRKIVGYELFPSLTAEGPLNALKKAMAQRKGTYGWKLIHHSDRGVQYCSAEYVELLRKDKILISMTESGSPYDNALAERVNGILKTELLPGKMSNSHQEAKSFVERSIRIYNEKRPHGSINNLVPNEAHDLNGILPKKWSTKKKVSNPLSSEHSK
jgi:transposase InsO family protein